MKQLIFSFLLFGCSTQLLAQAPPPAAPPAKKDLPLTQEQLFIRSNRMAEAASATREKERVEESAKALAEHIRSLSEKKDAAGKPASLADANPINKFDFRAHDKESILSRFFTDFVETLANHTEDYAWIGPHLFPNVMIPDIARLATNAAGFDAGTCYERTVDLGRWCFKVTKSIKIPFCCTIPIEIRLTPSAHYSMPVSKTEAAERPFMTRYMPYLFVDAAHTTLTEFPQSAQLGFELASKNQAMKRLSFVDPSLKVPPPPSAISVPNSMMVEAAKAADETLRKFPQRQRYLGTTSSGHAESMLVPEITSRVLPKIINDTLPNKTLGITISLLSAFDLASIVTTISSIANLMNQLNQLQKFQQMMKDFQSSLYYKNLNSPKDLGNRWDDLTTKLNKEGKTIGSLNLQEMGKEFGANIDKLQNQLDSALSGNLSMSATVGIVDVKVMCHNVKSPATYEEWNPTTQFLSSYFLGTSAKNTTGFYVISRFPSAMASKTELQKYSKARNEFMANPLMCSSFNFTTDAEGKRSTTLKLEPPQSEWCEEGQSLTDFSYNANAAYDGQRSAKGAWNGFTLGAIYNQKNFYNFNKDTDKFLWISPDPRIKQECLPLFQSYVETGSKNPEGHANIMLPEDMPNTAVQWRRFHCCPDEGARPMRPFFGIPLIGGSWDEVKE